MAYLSQEEEEKYNIDLTNLKFGKLTVLYDTGKKSKNWYKIWHCKCSCGKELDIKSTRLINHLISSCGCDHPKSLGENKIINILKENNIFFEMQKTFDDCRNPETNYLLKFDFWVNNKYIIEYDGKQHFEVSGWATKEKVLQTQKNDTFKNCYCKNIIFLLLEFHIHIIIFYV